MKEIIYAGFAQLSYLDWHNLDDKSIGLKLNKVFGTDIKIFNQIKTKDYKKMETDGSDYYVKKDEKGRKIYNATDARSFYLYSEDGNEPNMNPFYAEFGEWELKTQLVIRN